ncbi:MFS transporter [Pochonia chlamydosporia 170]|uniref:MFS transporter n=1 Tax=Pochonia chlamydosporia 170 TaxID=1380566 RepID=A0A179FR24_METCM|nr:MFS transporter [Pochonia chlamydosporia 170]OAQ67660.2 MFS transporter [Pochonia chlamydosporia 170]
MASCSDTGGSTSKNEDDKAASWVAMPQKQQLALIVMARFCETIADGSLQSFIIFQLRSFMLPDGSAPSTAMVALQLSLLRASVATPQLVTSTLWGVLADHPRIGRKPVIVFGLATAGVASLGLAFTRSFVGAVLCRMLVGLANGNKPAMRSMIREISGDKFESRAVLLLPIAFNIGSIVGPVLGGLLAEGAVNGSPWLSRWPFALPNVVNGIMQMSCAVLIAFHLRETLSDASKSKCKRGRRVYTSMVPEWARRLYGRYFQRKQQYELLENLEQEMEERGECETAGAPKLDAKKRYVSIWTRRLGLTLAARALLVMHIFSYPALLLVFTSTPRYQPVDASATTTTAASAVAEGNVRTNGTSAYIPVPAGYHPHAPFTFTGGLAFKPHDLAAVFAIRGLVGLLLQLLFFPYLRDVFGTLRLYRYALLVFPVTYFVTPYLATIKSSTLPPLPSSGVSLWVMVSAILVIQSTARSLALPAGSMLLNAACPDRSVLGTVNGIGQSVSSAARAIGQLMMTGWLYGVGLKVGMVGIAWWAMAGVATAAAVAAACVPVEPSSEKRESST